MKVYVISVDTYLEPNGSVFMSDMAHEFIFEEELPLFFYASRVPYMDIHIRLYYF